MSLLLFPPTFTVVSLTHNLTVLLGAPFWQTFRFPINDSFPSHSYFIASHNIYLNCVNILGPSGHKQFGGQKLLILGEPTTQLVSRVPTAAEKGVLPIGLQYWGQGVCGGVPTEGVCDHSSAEFVSRVCEAASTLINSHRVRCSVTVPGWGIDRCPVAAKCYVQQKQSAQRRRDHFWLK